ncbi:MAG: metallophosphoesterase [Clostridia bacterium]|nr:metallophosphoesterase [Clostridia bacterium]
MKNDFSPVFRFVICSDSHIEGIGSPGYNRLKEVIDYSLDFAVKDEHYNKIDTFFIAGDITNKGSKEEFDAFKEIYDYAADKGAKFLCTVAKGHDSITMGKKSLEYYKSLTNQETDFHRVIGGYHFIGLSTGKTPNKHYSFLQKLWLKKEMKKAYADTPDKPVFFIHHEHVKNTVYGSSDFDGWGNRFFTGVSDKYPNIVDFSGHSHYPVNDPRSIWQGAFTAIGTGSLKYTELTVDDERKVHPDFYDDCANFLIVEADKDSNLRVIGVDCMAEEILCEYYLKNPADKNNREYTKEKQIARSEAPAFAEGAEITVEDQSDIYVVGYPKADSTDGMPVFIYRIYVENADGKTVKMRKQIPTYYLYGEDEELRECLGMFARGKYKVKIFAENCFGMKSEPIEKEIII